jgi:hypothetical protein
VSVLSHRLAWTRRAGRVLTVISVGAISQVGVDSKGRSQEVNIYHIDYETYNNDLCDGEIMNSVMLCVETAVKMIAKANLLVICGRSLSA